MDGFQGKKKLIAKIFGYNYNQSIRTLKGNDIDAHYSVHLERPVINRLKRQQSLGKLQTKTALLILSYLVRCITKTIKGTE